jgi:virginiamycin B lyase
MARPASSAFAILAALLVLLAVAGSASAAPAVDGFFAVKGLEINNKIVAGPDGNMWVTLSNGKDVARITPGGQVQEFDLEGVEGAQGIAPGPDGNLWVPTTGKLTRFSPADPEGTDQTFSTAAINAEGQIVAGPDGLLWVASKNALAHFSPADPEGTVQPVAVSGELSPKDIDVAGSLIVVADTGSPRIATFTTAGVQVDYALAGGSQGLAGGPGGQIAFSQPSAAPEEIGLINPPSPALTTPIDGDPFGVALGSDGAYWFTRSAVGEVIRFTTSGQLTTLGGFPPKYFPRQVGAGPGNTIWVTAEIPGENQAGVARVSGLEPPAVAISAVEAATPQTKIGKGPKKVVRTERKRAKVKFRFSSTTAGAKFQCALTRLKGKKTKPAPFKGCKSPKVYRLGPGRYRFQVRAVAGGAVDPTPAARKFRVVRVPAH